MGRVDAFQRKKFSGPSRLATLGARAGGQQAQYYRCELDEFRRFFRSSLTLAETSTPPVATSRTSRTYHTMSDPIAPSLLVMRLALADLLLGLLESAS